jgi:GNAT superfamily N-acetyltransferase
VTSESILKDVPFDHEHFQLLIKELDKEFWVRYPDTQQNFDPFNKVDASCHVILAYLNEEPAGCGCYRPKLADTVEIKRMYVRPAFRNRGLAGQILARLERQAAGKGFSRSILETGNKQPEAIRTYQKNGYHIIPNFPPYENVRESICMEKMLPKV